MTSTIVRRVASACAVVVAVAACGSSGTTPTTTGSITLPDGTSSPSVDTATTADSTSAMTGSEDNAETTESAELPTASVTPALGITVNAADTFDSDFLQAGRGSNFVPMDDPTMVPAAEVTWLNEDTVVMGVAHTSGESHAYPVGQMAYHHIANTTIAGEPFLVTY